MDQKKNGMLRKMIRSLFLSGLICLLMGAFSICVSASGYDTTPPEIGRARILQDSVYAPGTVTVEISDIVEEESGISEVSVVIARFDPKTGVCLGSATTMGRTERLLFTGDSLNVTIPVESKVSSGIYHISNISLSDSRGNFTMYSSNSRYMTENNNTEYELKQSGAVIANPDQVCKASGLVRVYGDDADLDLASSNPYIPTKIREMPDGKVARVFIDQTGYSIISQETFEAIKGTNKKLQVTVGPGVKWLFDGKDVINATKDVDCQLQISTRSGTEYGSERNILQIEFAPNGILPGKATVQLKSDYIYQLYQMTGEMYLYYVNCSNLQLEDNPQYILDGTDHWCKFEVTHNSKFWVSGKPLSTKTTGSPSGIILNKTSVSLNPGQSFTLKVTGKAASDKVVSFKSSNSKIATVTKKGKITAKKTGSCVITVKMKSGLSAKCKVKVQQKTPTGISGVPSAKTLKKGASYTIKGKILPSGASGKLTYSSSNKKVAVVNQNGKITAKKKGTAKITVKIGKIKKVCKVTVK